MGIPDITFANDRTIISTKFSCTVKFKVTENFREFEARATIAGQPYGRGIGILLMNMSIASPNYYPANTEYTYIITDQNLTSGDGTYRISMYAKNTDGIWSDTVAFTWDGTNGNGWDVGTWV